MKSDLSEYSVTFYKDYEFVKPSNNKIEHKVYEAYKDCRDEYFCSFISSYILDVEFIKTKKK